MLLFIKALPSFCPSPVHFNTSHVTVYQSSSFRLTLLIQHFNTSHVTVYPFSSPLTSGVIAFQYISCYCLSTPHMAHRVLNGISIHLMLLFILLLMMLRSLLLHFNTSHVTVYRLRSGRDLPDEHISIHLMLLFIEYGRTDQGHGS